ncbi:MAG: sulfatase-like hydrolase/transferase, partial [Planctomycetes bacterium]|nr:sulfatase-like hydrolase/transferase [Planctomycetota bacterium]
HSHASKGTLAADRSMLNGIPLAPSQLTLAEYLAGRGYNTAAFVANYVWLARQFGLQQGFAWYHDRPRYLIFLKSGTPLYKHGLRIADRLLGRNGKLLQGYWSARTVTRFARSWTAKNSRTPFFLFLNYMDPHETYAPLPGFDRIQGKDIPYNDMLTHLSRWQKFRDDYITNGGTLDETFLQQVANQYDGELAYCDHFLGEFIESLKEQGIYDNTLIIITSDHGEFFGEHQLLNHGVGIYEGGLRVPILVKYPGREHAGEVISERVSIGDIFATVLEVLGFALPECSARPLGAAARPILAEDYENHQKVRQYGERFRRSQTVIYSGDWKYIHSSNGSHELYNLRSDPQETINLVDLRPAIARDLAAGIADWREKTPYFDGTAHIQEQMTPEMRRRLRSLGYLGGGASH